MSNWSIGIDIIEIEKFQQYNIDEHRSFYNKIFNDYETNYCQTFKDPHPHFAGIFAAKEAVYKAINEFAKIELYHVFISHDKTKKPIAKIDYKDENTKKLEEINQQLKKIIIKVSIAHTEKTAIAWALVIYQDQTEKLAENWDDIDKAVQEVIQNEFPSKNTT